MMSALSDLMHAVHRPTPTPSSGVECDGSAASRALAPSTSWGWGDVLDLLNAVEAYPLGLPDAEIAADTKAREPVPAE